MGRRSTIRNTGAYGIPFAELQKLFALVQLDVQVIGGAHVPPGIESHQQK